MFQMPRRLLAIGDIHGDIIKLKNALISYEIIDSSSNWIAKPPDTYIVQVGDQIDSSMRTENSNNTWESSADIEVILYMDMLDEVAKKYGGRVFSLIGNHEIMNVEANFNYVSNESMIKSGGKQTRQALFEPGGEIAQILSKRYAVIKIGDMLFCHAGILPHHLKLVDNNLTFINEICQRYLRKESVNIDIFRKLFIHPDGIVWTRSYALLPDDQLRNDIDEVLRITGAGRIIVGHTVVNSISNRLDNKIWFIDCGLSRSFGLNNITQFLNITRL